MEIQGKIKLIGDLQTFDSGFKKREFVITTEDKYPQDIKFEVTKEKAEEFTKYQKVGQDVKVLFDIRGNEYNGKYYVNLEAWRVEGQEMTKAVEMVESKLHETDLPF